MGGPARVTCPERPLQHGHAHTHARAHGRAGRQAGFRRGGTVAGGSQ